MKIQMKFQKILSLVTLILGALTLVYALIFFSGSLSDITALKGSNGVYQPPADGLLLRDPIEVGGLNFFKSAQTFNDILFTVAIVYLVITITLFITASNKRRNYYITNYISIILVAVSAVAFFIFVYAELSILIGSFNSDINWENLLKAHEMSFNENTNSYAFPYDKSYTMFIIGYVLFFLILLNAVALILNLLWKIKLMQGEKKLLEGGLVKEVA